MGVVLYDIYKVLRLSSIKQKVSESTKDLPEDEKLEALIKANPVLLSVSLDGWWKTHDLNRGQKGIFDKISEEKENSKINLDIKDGKIVF